MDRRLTLGDGHKMPLLGLGCWQCPKEEVANAVFEAIRAGYRLIDTAYSYLNEDGVGEGIALAIKKGIVKRSDLFVVTKLPLTGMRAHEVEEFLKKSLNAMGLAYVDLYLVHSPTGLMRQADDRNVFPRKSDGTMDSDYSTDLIAVWKAMEKIVDRGLARSIGISNFNSKQIRKMIAIARIPPSVLQVECSLYFQQKPLRKFCKENNVAFMSYGSLGSPGRKALYVSRGMKPEDVDKMLPDILNNPIVALVAQKHKKTAAQIALKFLIQQDIIIIPKSSSAARIQQNGDLFDFELNETDMAALEFLDQGRDGRSFNVSKIFEGLECHPEASLTEPF